jgi:hypothetical protein
MSPKSPKSPNWISGPVREKESSKSSISLDTGLAGPPPNPGHLRLLLSQAASDYLSATGESAFMVIGKASHPDDPSRWILHLVPVPMATAAAACNVALGTHRAVKIKPTSAP